MDLAGRLRALDERFLGKPKRATAATYRKSFFVCLVATLVLLVVVVALGEWLLLAGTGGLIGVTIGHGLLWRRSARASSPR